MIDRLTPPSDHHFGWAARRTAADLAADAECSRLFSERLASRLPSAGGVAAPPPDVPTLGALTPAGASSCTGPFRIGGDASGERAAGLVPRAADPSAPVSPHVVPHGGAGTSPVVEQGDAAHRGPVRNAERTTKPLSGVHAMGSARGASAAEPAHGRPPARSLPHPDDGTCWGEPAPASRRLPPLAYLALLLAASWLALLAVAAVEAARALFLRP